MSRIARIWMSALGGLRVSKPGASAQYGVDADMLFSTERTQAMMVGYGTFQMTSGSNPVFYDVPQVDEPIVFCGLLGTHSLYSTGGSFDVAPVQAQHAQSGGKYTGFLAVPLGNFAGNPSAVGKTCQWLAFPGLPASV